MKKMTSVVGSAAFAATVVALAAGTASAASSVAPAPATTRIVTTPLGALADAGGRIDVADRKGDPVYGKPFAVAPKAVTATPAPVPAGTAAPKAVSTPLRNIDWQGDFNTDLGVASTQFGLATGVGGLVGGLVGVIGGCAVGGLIGAAISPEIFFTGGLPGCLAGIGLGGTIGPILGGALLGIPVGIASTAQMYNTMRLAGEVSAPIAMPKR